MARPLEAMREPWRGGSAPARRLQLVTDPSPERIPSAARRTCARCGEHTWFRIEPDGGWSSCSACGRYA